MSFLGVSFCAVDLRSKMGSKVNDGALDGQVTILRPQAIFRPLKATTGSKIEAIKKDSTEEFRWQRTIKTHTTTMPRFHDETTWNL